MGVKKIWQILKGTVSEFSEDNVLRLSAALAYYSIFSIGPLLAIVVGVAGLVFGSESARHNILSQLQALLGPKATHMVESMMSARHQGGSLAATIIGIVALLFGAGGVFGQLQDSLNTIWEVKARPDAGIWALVRNRFLSFSMVLGIGFLLLVSMVLSTALGALTHSLGKFAGFGWIAHGLDFAVSFCVITVLFAMIFKVLPDVKVAWRKVWIGAVGTTILFTIGKVLLGLYLGRSSTSSAYGAAGAVILVLMWVYYASVILLFGAEFTQVYTKQTGARVRPSKYAVPVTAEERAEQGIPKPDKPKPLPQPAGVPAAARQGGSPAPAAVNSEVSIKEDVGVLSVVLATGFIAGLLFRVKMVRKALRLIGQSSRG